MKAPFHTEQDAAVYRRLAAVTPQARLEAAWAAYQEARISGLCHEGAWECALGTARHPRQERTEHPTR